MSTLKAPVFPIVLHPNPPQDHVLGTILPMINPGGCELPFAYTCITPITIPENGIILSWKSEFEPAFFSTWDASVVVGPTRMQMKVLRKNASSIYFSVAKEGRIQDPRPLLQARFGPVPQNFACADSVTSFTESHLTVQKNDILALTFLPDAKEQPWYPYDFTVPLIDAVNGDVEVGSDVIPNSGVGRPLVEVQFTTALWVKILVGQKEVWLPPRVPKSTMLPIEVLSSNLVNASDIDPKSVHIGALRPTSTRLVTAAGKCRALLCEFDLAEIIAQTHQIPPNQRFPLEIILEGKTTYGERIYGHHALPIEVRG